MGKVVSSRILMVVRSTKIRFWESSEGLSTVYEKGQTFEEKATYLRFREFGPAKRYAFSVSVQWVVLWITPVYTCGPEGIAE